MGLKRILLKYINLLVFVIVIFVIAQNIVYLLKRSIGEEKRGLPNEVALKKSNSCESNRIWIELNRVIFIKRSSAFYLSDIGVLKFFYVASSRIPFNITAELSVISSQEIIHRSNISELSLKPSYVYSIGNYMIKIIEVKLSDDIVSGGDSLNLNFYSGRQKTNVPLEVQIKTTGSYSEKKSAVICSKCFFLNSEEDYRNFDWWLELNKNIGYEKISFCDDSINLEYFKHRENLIETESLKCIPNFIGSVSKDKYLTSLTQLRYNGVFSYASTDIFNVIMTNQCYLKNFDKYKYITVVDNDETVIPRISESHTTLDDYHEFLINANLDSDYTEIERQVSNIKCSENRITEYMDRVKPKNDPTSISFYFQQAFYLNHDIMDRLLDILGEKLDKRGNKYKEGTKFNITLSEAGQFNYTFQISNEDEFKYAVNLVKMSKRYVKPFMEKNRVKLAKLSENYRRVFALVSEGDNQFTSGKSVHTTNHTRNVCVHSLCGKRDRLVRQSIGHLAHFRRFFIFRKFILFSIKQLVFDFNYLNCFVKPILNK